MVPFLLNMKNFGSKIEIQFNNTLLVAEQNNHKTKTVNAYIVQTFYVENWLLGATNIVKIESMCINAMEQHLMEKVCGSFIMTLLEML